ncbi:MAG: flagellar biosynthetic protein FliR [Rhodocyclaceae bacterium]|nr:flagellar biosynthetic protein FliR [Rhodocyclaceae bacterium]
MISVTSAQLDAWVAAVMFPLARVLGLFFAAPIFGNAAIPERIKLIAGVLVTLAIVPALPPMPEVPAGSWAGLAILARQTVIGLLLGFSLRIVFAAVDMAGQLIGLQMGLSFAIFYDPLNASQTPVVGELFGLLATLIFLALNGHLLSLSLLAQSFTLLPVSANAVSATAYSAFLAWGATIFSTGLLLSLPLIAALLIANIAMGVLSRVAPQLNLFAVGFPVTIVSGFIVTMISLPYFGAALERLFDQGFAAMTVIMKAGAG